MGLAFTCPGDGALDEGWEALFMRSVSFTDKGVKSILRSISFNGRDSEPTILKAFGSGKLIIQGSVSFKEDNDPYQFQTKISIKSPTSDQESPIKPSFKASRFNPSRKTAVMAPPESPLVEAVQDCHKHEAAVKLQKVYKSFRTRRQLADCAVLVEQQWWKLLDFALLKQSSVSFFDINEPETAVSRWMRARRRAAKVGKGLSQDKKAQKLALQHWLEAIDPRHRYGHNLHFYYNCWLKCESKEPFFYWLDVGGGKHVNLEEKCPRLTLQQQCIKYLGPKEREAYEVKVEDGKFMYKTSGNILDTSEGPKDSKWIFVLSTSKTLYVGQKKKGKFQHSSFLAGGATSAAGRLVVDNGILRAVWPHSGHYRPTKENFQELMSFLKENKVDLTDVQLSPAEDDDEMHGFKCANSELALARKNSSTGPQIEVSCTSIETRSTVLPKKTKSIEPLDGVKHQKLHKKTILKNQEESDDETDEKINFSESKRNDWSGRVDGSNFSHSAEDLSSISIGDYVFCKKNLFQEQEEEDEEASVPQESILRRINSHKGMKSYQLGKQLSCKWTTGAGPRIGCVRDYPSELQFRALEQVNLSPRSDRPYPSPRPFMSPRPLPSPRNPSLPSPRKLSLPSPRNPSLPSPRMPEVPLFRKVPLLQKPKFCR